VVIAIKARTNWYRQNASRSMEHWAQEKVALTEKRKKKRLVVPAALRD